jgi:hypothetical protein
MIFTYILALYQQHSLGLLNNAPVPAVHSTSSLHTCKVKKYIIIKLTMQTIVLSLKIRISIWNMYVPNVVCVWLHYVCTYIQYVLCTALHYRFQNKVNIHTHCTAHCIINIKNPLNMTKTPVNVACEAWSSKIRMRK